MILRNIRSTYLEAQLLVEILCTRLGDLFGIDLEPGYALRKSGHKDIPSAKQTYMYSSVRLLGSRLPRIRLAHKL